MKIVLQTLNETIEFLSSYEVKDHDNLTKFSDKVAALTFLHHVTAHLRDLSRLRTVLAKAGNGINVNQLNDQQMLEVLANCLFYDQIKVRRTRKTPHSVTGIGPKSPQYMTPRETEQLEKTRPGKRGSTQPPMLSSTTKESTPVIEPPTLANPNEVTPPVVTAKASVNNSIFFDVNQTARINADAQKPTMSWTLGYGQNCRGGNKKGVSWADIEKTLLEVQEYSGTVTLDVVDGAAIGPQSLQVEKEGNFSILSLGEYDGEDYNVRSFTNDSTEEQPIEILGNLWDARMVCSEFNLVIKIFKEFFETGNVSQKLLS